MSSSDLAVTMYESDPMVAALNKVSGFDPLKLMSRKRIPGAEKDEKSLDFRYKKLWFRLAHRTGRIRLNRLSITEQLAVIEAQVYLELTDTNPVSSFTAACTREEGGDKYIENAQIKAMDQALTDAGFGLQLVPVPAGGMEKTVSQTPQSVKQQGQQAGVPRNMVAAQSAPRQRTVLQQLASQQKTPAVQATSQQQTVAQQAGVPQKATALAASPQRTAVQQAGVQQENTAAQAISRQCTVAQRSEVQQQATVSQQRPVAQQPTTQQHPTATQTAVRQQVAAQPQAAASVRSAQTIQGQTAQGGQKVTAIPAQAGQQRTAVSSEASASSQKATASAPAPQTASRQLVSTEVLPACQIPAPAEEQALPVTSDMETAISMLSGKREDTLPAAPTATTAGEAGELADAVRAASVVPNAAISVASAAEPPFVDSPAANADVAANEGISYTAETSIEEILQSMTLDDAKKVVVPTGTCQGWTLDEVAQRRRPSLRFYLSEGYQGKDNILRAAARLVLDDLEKKAG